MKKHLKTAWLDVHRGNFLWGNNWAHFRTLKTLPWPWFREGISVLKRKSNIFGFLWENRRFLGFSRQGIDCAHSRSVKTFPWPSFRKGSGCIEAKIEKIFEFFEKTADSYVFLGGESIARTPELWKCFLDPDSGKGSVFWREINLFT